MRMACHSSRALRPSRSAAELVTPPSTEYPARLFELPRTVFQKGHWSSERCAMNSAFAAHRHSSLYHGQVASIPGRYRLPSAPDHRDMSSGAFQNKTKGDVCALCVGTDPFPSFSYFSCTTTHILVLWSALHARLLLRSWRRKRMNAGHDTIHNAANNGKPFVSKTCTFQKYLPTHWLADDYLTKRVRVDQRVDRSRLSEVTALRGASQGILAGGAESFELLAPAIEETGSLVRAEERPVLTCVATLGHSHRGKRCQTTLCIVPPTSIGYNMAHSKVYPWPTKTPPFSKRNMPNPPFRAEGKRHRTPRARAPPPRSEVGSAAFPPNPFIHHRFTSMYPCGGGQTTFSTLRGLGFTRMYLRLQQESGNKQIRL